MKLYPRLPLAVASSIAESRRAMSVEQLQEVSSCVHNAVLYAPTGGVKVEEEEIAALREELRSVASIAGYPNAKTDAAHRRFDGEAAALLHRSMSITAAEASRQEIWSFLSCVVFPDLVRWRFPGGDDGTTSERFLGGARGVRNTLGRLWWRAFTLLDETNTDPYHLVQALGEDELVQIMERPAIAGSRRLARRLVVLTLAAPKSGADKMSRTDILREAARRTRRLLAILDPDLMSDAQLDEALAPLFGIDVSADSSEEPLSEAV